MYLSQGNNFVKESVWKKIEDLRLNELNLMLVGDFNIDARDNDVLLQHFIDNHLVQLVKEPTHFQGRIIDHLWVTKNFQNLKLSFQYPYYTQHKSLIVNFK